MDEDNFLIDDEEEAAGATVSYALLIVDDEPAIHDVTRLALRGVRFDQRELEMISAYSAAEALDVLAARDDVAVILLDVVMETESAGLDLVHTIRNDLNNTDVRIILRTGQPGQAPEERVFAEYDINDYKAKAELTRRHLVTSLYSALRAWRDLQKVHLRRRQSEQLAGQRAAVIAVTLDLIDAPAAVLDSEGTILARNQALTDLTGRRDAGRLEVADLGGTAGVLKAALGGVSEAGPATVPLTTDGGRRWKALLQRAAGISGDSAGQETEAMVLRLDPVE